MFILELRKIAYISANGNYSELMFIEGQKQMLTLGLSQIELIIKRSFPAGSISPFIRLGRSLIINQNYVYYVNTVRQIITLSDCANHTYHLNVPKLLLKEYKNIIYRKFAHLQTEENNGK